MSCHCCSDPWRVAHKDFTRGGVDVKDFDDDVVTWKKAAKKKKIAKKSGCPGNDNGPHVYVWVPEPSRRTDYFYSYLLYEDMFEDYFGYEKYETRVCAGCTFVNPRRRLTERYMNEADKVFHKYFRDASADYRGKPMPRYRIYRRFGAPAFDAAHWERSVPEFKALVEAERDRRAEVRQELHEEVPVTPSVV